MNRPEILCHVSYTVTCQAFRSGSAKDHLPREKGDAFLDALHNTYGLFENLPKHCGFGVELPVLSFWGRAGGRRHEDFVFLWFNPFSSLSFAVLANTQTRIAV